MIGSSASYSNAARLVSLGAALHVDDHRLVLGCSSCVKASTVMLALSLSTCQSPFCDGAVVCSAGGLLESGYCGMARLATLM